MQRGMFHPENENIALIYENGIAIYMDAVIQLDVNEERSRLSLEKKHLGGEH